MIEPAEMRLPQVTEINDARDLEALALAWKCMLARTRQASFFHSLDWLLAYWRHFGQGQRLRVCVVRSHGELLGIVPLVVRPEKTRVGTVRVLTYPLDDWAAFYSALGPQPAATMTAALAYLRQTRRDWDLVDLRWVDRDGCDARRTECAMHAAGMPACEQPAGQAALIETKEGWPAYWAGLGSRWRNNLGRCERRLSANGRVHYVRYRPAGAAAGEEDPRWDLYEACRQIARRSWQGESRTGTTLSHASVKAFLADAHQAAARAGGLDLNLLWVDSLPVAFAYNYHCQGRVSGLRMGYDASATREGAGSVLMRRMIQDSFERGDQTIDLGPGSLACKRRWQTSLATSYRYTHFAAASPRAGALRLKRGLSNWLAARQSS